MLVSSRLSLKLKGTPTPYKSSQRPLTLTARGATDHSNAGISIAPWDLKSLSKDISWFPVKLHMDPIGKGELIYNKLV